MVAQFRGGIRDCCFSPGAHLGYVFYQLLFGAR